MVAIAKDSTGMALQLYEGVSSPFTPFFSVVICTFNRAHLLPRALNSVLEQEESSWEVIVVDDGSTDNTLEVVRPYLQAAPNIRYMAHRNRGLPVSRNVGIAAAIGEYVTFLDSDDWYLPNHLSSRRAILAQNPGVELLHGGCEIIGNPFVPDKYNPERMLNLHDLVVGGTYIFPRAYAVKIGGFPAWSPYSIDGDLYDELEKLGTKILRTEERTYMYDRTTPDSICHIVADGGIEALTEFRRQGHWDSPHARAELAAD
jgi:glycosyltransferase involved in cell wall biosynthesis